MALRLFAISFLIVGFNVVIGGFLSAVEQPRESLLISLGRGLLFIALSLVALTALFGGAGIWHAATLSEALCLVLSYICLRRKR